MDPKWYFIGLALQILVGGFQGLVVWMGKRIIDGYERRLTLIENNCSCRVNPEEFDRLRTKSDESVSKEEWLRSYGQVNQRLEKIGSKLDQFDGAQQAAVQIGAAIAAALNAKREERES